MAHVTKKDQRTLQEKQQKKCYDHFVESFYEFYNKKLKQNARDVMFAFNKKVDKLNKYAIIGFNKKYNSIMVYINLKLVDEPKSLTELTAKRMATKVFLFKNHLPYGELDKEYLMLANKFHLWNYGKYAETPQKWHVYKCSICGTPMAVFPQRLPNNNELTKNQKTPWHNKQLVNAYESSSKVHQGNYAYSGYEELTNDELQKILLIMKRSVEFTKNFTDNELHYEVNDSDDFDIW